MNFYFKYRKLGAIFIEASPKLGLYPLYSFSKWKNEHIIELPWIEIILTPASAIKKEIENITNGDSTTNPIRYGSSVISITGHTPPHPEN
jgi:hypothetical protein